MADLREFSTPLWLVGCGNMAGAMLARWLDAALDPGLVTVIRPSGRAPAPGIRTLAALPDAAAPAIVLLGVKPQKLDEVAAPLAARIEPATTLVSILAGVDLATLRARVPRAGAVVRAMPNTPVALGRGVVGLVGDESVAVDRLLAPLGLVARVPDEARFEALAALSGCGPAFLFRFVDALAAAGARLGLDPALAAELALATVDGAAGLAVAAPESPAQLADRVASPGGMTRRGLDVLDRDRALDRLIAETLDAAFARGREMAAAARDG